MALVRTGSKGSFSSSVFSRIALFVTALSFGGAALLPSLSSADDSVGGLTVPAGTPDCMANGKPLSLNNNQVLGWKDSTKSGYLDRGFVIGITTRALPGDKGHIKWEIKIGPQADDVIELVFNTEFGPELKIPAAGTKVVACGDYITANEKNGGYNPSPSGAIIHWIHWNPGTRDGGKHPHGYVMVDGKLWGFPKNGMNPPGLRPVGPPSRGGRNPGPRPGNGRLVGGLDRDADGAWVGAPR